MALQTSGAISLNDMHVEAGGTSGTSVSINDADIRALIGRASGVPMGFSAWYGATSLVWDMATAIVDSASSSTLAVAYAALYLRTDMTWDSYGSTDRLNNPILPEKSGSVPLWYRLVSKDSVVTGTGTATSWTALSSGDVHWRVDATASGATGSVSNSGSVTFELATSSSGAGAKVFTCYFTANADFTGIIQ